MKIEFEITDEEFEKIKPTLKRNLSIDDNNLSEKLNLIAKTSFLEYVDMITKNGIPTKVSDVIQERVLLLIDNYFEKIPNEIEISKMFNLPLNKSRLILNTMNSIYRNRINEKLEKALKTFIESGQSIESNSKYEYVVKSKPLIIELNEVISIEKPGLDKFTQKSNCAGKYTISKDTYDFLKSKFQ
jgi:hypothetical protein